MHEKPIRNSGNLKVMTPSDREIAMVRVFNAPRELVYKALTTPDLLKRWLGVHNGWQMVTCEIDLRVGGAYRYYWHGRDGMKMGMGGVYQEIDGPERIVATERFDESWYPGAAIVTTTLEESHGNTTLTTVVLYDTKEARDGVLKSPMEHGVAAAYDKLEEIMDAEI